MSTATIIRELWEVAGEGNLTDDQLRKLVCCEELSSDLQGLAHTMTGIGCLVNSDGDKEGIRAGNFQSGRDVPELLFCLANSIEAMSEAIFVSSQASALLLQRERAKNATGKKPTKERS